MTNDTDLARLRWRCRRGTREMDLLCEHFLERIYPGLDEAGQHAFAQLLEESDKDIMNWVSGKSDPADPACQAVIHLLRQQPPGSTSG